MKFASPFATHDEPTTDERPRDDELDLYGLTHPGRVRAENQDHFLLCTVHPQVVVHGTSLPNDDAMSLRGQRLATIMLVADSVVAMSRASLRARASARTASWASMAAARSASISSPSPLAPAAWYERRLDAT